MTRHTKTPLLLCGLVAGLASLAATASAQDSDSLTVKSKVNPYCSTLSETVAAPLNLGSLTNSDGRAVTTFEGTTSRDLGSYYCNGPATITLTAGALIQTANTVIVEPASFTNRIDYLATLTWDDVVRTVATDAVAPAVSSVPEANIGSLIVSVSNPAAPGNRRPIAGAYAGSVTVTVALQP